MNCALTVRPRKVGRHVRARASTQMREGDRGQCPQAGSPAERGLRGGAVWPGAGRGGRGLTPGRVRAQARSRLLQEGQRLLRAPPGNAATPSRDLPHTRERGRVDVSERLARGSYFTKRREGGRGCGSHNLDPRKPPQGEGPKPMGKLSSLSSQAACGQLRLQGGLPGGGGRPRRRARLTEQWQGGHFKDTETAGWSRHRDRTRDRVHPECPQGQARVAHRGSRARGHRMKVTLSNPGAAPHLARHPAPFRRRTHTVA